MIFFSFIYSFICPPRYFPSLSLHTWISGWVMLESSPSPGSRDKALGGAARSTFFSLDLFGFLFESMALHGNWTERLAKQKTSDGELYASMIFEWMPATFSTGSFESLSLFSKFLVIDWMIFWGASKEEGFFLFVCLFTFCVPLSKKDKWGWNYWENSDSTTNFSDLVFTPETPDSCQIR